MKKWTDFRIIFLGLVLGLGGFKGADDVSLSTAKVFDETSPKPTALHRRINVEINFGDNTIMPLDLFRLRNKELRRSRSDVWNWDSWCQLQPKIGNCSKPRSRFYYDTQLDQCKTFTFSGCGGNQNQFETITDCGRFCKGATYMPIRNLSSKTFCALQPDSGLCMAMFYKYYYDVNENRCKTFIYGGCGGNQNRFGSMGQCVKECSQDSEYADDEIIV